jgi:hypothetical protein
MSRFTAVASSLFAVAAGCGDDGHFIPPDAGDDAPPMVDARPSGAVTVTTMVRCCTVTPGTPQAGVTVAVAQPDGTLGETGVTDAAGQVSFANVQLGASITAIYPEDAYGTTDISTIAGVKPGDTLTFGENYYQPDIADAAPTGSVTFNYPHSYYYYQVYGPCSVVGSHSASASLSRRPGCDPATAAITLQAYDNNMNKVATAYLPAADFSGETPVTVESWSPDRTDFEVSMTGMTPPMSVGFEVVAPYPNARLYNYADVGEPTNGTASTMLTAPTTAPAIKTFAYVERGRLEGDQRVYVSGTSPVTFAAPTLPWLSAAIVNVKTGKAGWYQTEGTADGAVFHLEWNRWDDAAETSHYYRWNLVLPPGVTELELESPVPALAAVLPEIVDDVYAPEVRLIDLSSTADYDAFRQLPEWRMTDVPSSILAGHEAMASESISADGGEGVGLRVIK